MPAIHQIFYVSRASAPHDGDAIRSILHGSRRNNARRDVTGCLLFSGTCFAQVLEGDPAEVSTLAAKIAADARHTDLRILVERDVAQRAHASWSMAYLHALTLEDELEALLQSGAQSTEALSDLFARIRPDSVMGALS